MNISDKIDVRIISAAKGMYSGTKGERLVSPEVMSHNIRHKESGVSLTPREREVILLVSQGYTNLEIASRLYIGHQVVRNYVSRCLDKLQLDNRAELTRWAKRNDIERNMERAPSDPDNYKDLLFGVYA